MITSLMAAAWLGGSYLPSGGFLYPERSYHMGQARYYSTDPRRASVSGYAGASDPLVRPDYTGAAPDKPGASTSITVDAAVAHHAEASGENLAQLATTSEASLEGSSRTGSTVAASQVTVSTHQNPSPFAQRYLSDNSFRYDPAGARAVDNLIMDLPDKAIANLILNLPDNVSVSDFFLRMRIGRDPIASDLMRRMTETEAKNGFGRFLDIARVEPVTIEKQGQAIVVVLPVEEYQRLKEVDKKVTSSDAANHGKRLQR
ncbi:type II toxin-antitoxin system Phd/YefM family antitoxin [Thiolapillus sp.]|uniref:type II toxin-antitoxin system Phd/YefM family antitoxin n=3 Tax=Thiolapillus sp. TaxID=2017437 RepID=UPI003AF92C43